MLNSPPFTRLHSCSCGQGFKLAQQQQGASVSIPQYPPPGECSHEASISANVLGSMLSHLVVVHTAYQQGKVPHCSACDRPCMIVPAGDSAGLQELAVVIEDDMHLLQWPSAQVHSAPSAGLAGTSQVPLSRI